MKLIVVENALTTWNDPKTKSVFNDIVSVKSEGYGRSFNDPLLVIPFDVFDFVGTHVLLYSDDKLVMLYKNVFFHDCKRMNLTFPLHNFVRSGGKDEHKVAYAKFFEEYGSKRITYDSHLTVSNTAAQNPDLLYSCLSILHALAYHSRKHYEVDYSFMLGTFHAGTHKTFQKMGARPFQNLGPINLDFYDNREAMIMLCDGNFSQKTISLANEYASLWNNRIVISADTLEKIRVA